MGMCSKPRQQRWQAACASLRAYKLHDRHASNYTSAKLLGVFKWSRSGRSHVYRTST